MQYSTSYFPNINNTGSLSVFMLLDSLDYNLSLLQEQSLYQNLHVGSKYFSFLVDED